MVYDSRAPEADPAMDAQLLPTDAVGHFVESEPEKVVAPPRLREKFPESWIFTAKDRLAWVSGIRAA